MNASSASSSVRDVLDAAGVLPVGVLGADAGVVEAGGAGVDVGGLAVVVLQDVAQRAVQHAGLAGVKLAACWPRRVPRPPASTPMSCTTVVVDERGEDAGRVGAAADAGDDVVGQPAFDVPGTALAHSRADHAWKSRTIIGNGCGPTTRADDVVRVLDAAHPVAHRLVRRVLQRLAAARAPR